MKKMMSTEGTIAVTTVIMAAIRASRRKSTRLIGRPKGRVRSNFKKQK